MSSKIWALIYFVLTAVSFVYFIIDANPVDLSADWLASAQGSGVGALWSLPVLCSLNFGLLFVVQLASCLGQSGLVPWVVLVLSYLTQMVIPYSRGGHSLNMDLFILGMVVLEWPFQGATIVSRAFQHYWPLFVMMLLLLTNPHVRGRCDLHPMNTFWERIRFYSIEVILIVALASGAMNPSDPHGLLRWLNMWALYAYCIHIMWARLLPIPWGAVVTYASSILFLMCWLHQRRKESADDESESASDQGEYEADYDEETPAVSVEQFVH